MTTLEQYRDLAKRLIRVRLDNDDQATFEEEQILDKMDLVWMNLSYEEQIILMNEGPIGCFR